MSKDLQINWIIRALDLTPEGVKSAMRNMDRLSKHQQKLDKDRILNRQAVLQNIALAKAAKNQQEFQKKQNLSDLNSFKRLQTQKLAFERSMRLKSIAGNEQALRSHINGLKGYLGRLKNQSPMDYAGKATNLSKQLDTMKRINQTEATLGNLISSNIGKRNRELRIQQSQAREAERQARAIRQQRNNQIMMTGAAAGGALYIGRGGAADVLGSATMQEMMALSLRALEGDIVGNQMKQNIEKYATTTGFSTQEVSNLYKALIISGKTGGLNFSKNPEQRVLQMDELSRVIGNPILAFANKPEDKAELVNQLSQILGKKQADIRQDLRVMQGRGLALLQSEIQKITGKSVFGGGPVSSEIILEAWINMSKLPEVAKLMEERGYSLTQALDTLNETTYLTAGSFGLLVARATELPSKLNTVSDYLLKLRKAMDGTNEGSDMTGREALTAGQRLTVFGLAVGGLTLGILALAGAWKILGTYLGGGAGLGKAFLWASALYLIFSDWKSLFDDINKDGLGGLLNHLDKIVAILSILGGGWIAGGPAGLLVAAAGITGVAAYKYLTTDNELKKSVESRIQKQRVEAGWIHNNEKWKKPEGLLGASWSELPSMLSQKLFPKTEAAMIPSKQGTVSVGINNIINAATGETKTTINRNPSAIYNSYDKTYQFDGY